MRRLPEKHKKPAALKTTKVVSWAAGKEGSFRPWVFRGHAPMNTRGTNMETSGMNVTSISTRIIIR